MKCLTTISFLILCSVGEPSWRAVALAKEAAPRPKTVLTTDESIPIPKLNFDPNGELKITASATSSQSDFDFLVGKWEMHNRRLNKRLENCQDWTEFDSWDENQKILSGTADMDTYSTSMSPFKSTGQKAPPTFSMEASKR